MFSIEDGTLVKIATTKFGNDGSFGFLFKVPAENFYVIGQDSSPTVPKHYLYLKPGDAANVVIDNMNLSFEGKNSAENRMIGEWFAISNVCRNKAIYFTMSHSNFEDFYPDFDKLLAAIDPYLKKLKTPNPLFNERMAKWVLYDRDMFMINLMFTPRSKHPQANELHSFCKAFNKPSERYPSDDIFDYMYGIRLLTCYLMEYARENGISSNTDDKLALLATDRQKGEYLASEIARMRDFGQVEEFETKYGKYFVTPSLKERLDAKKRELFTSKPGNKALDFTYPDANGKLVSLSDFKGKVVLVDVWATWCGPCKQQIPYMKEMEEAYKGKDVAFISVSVDENDKKQDWLNMIKEKEMGGIQLFASGWSKICKDYNINSIPRFLVFDKKGNIVSIDAPRPSDPKLKELLDSELAK